MRNQQLINVKYKLAELVMTTKMRRCLKSNENRPNYAKRAKDFGLNYISIMNIQKYFTEDWEKLVESSKQRFDWKYITRSLIRNDVKKLNHRELFKVIGELEK